MTRDEQILEIANELTFQNRNTGGYRWAPSLRALGDKLKSLAAQPTTLMRDDIAAFAYKMSTMLDVKDSEKGAAQPLTIYEALAAIQAQIKKFGEYPTPSNIDTRRALIHIANFAMLAEKKLP